MNKKINQKRYRLHYAIRKQGYNLITPERTVYLKFEQNLTKQVLCLKNQYNYSVQMAAL